MHIYVYMTFFLIVLRLSSTSERPDVACHANTNLSREDSM